MRRISGHGVAASAALLLVSAPGWSQRAPAEGEAAFGALGRLAGTSWIGDDGYALTYSWTTRGEVLLRRAVGEGGEFRTRYRRGLDGETIIASREGEGGEQTLAFPTKDSWSETNAQYTAGCRLAVNATRMMCERREGGKTTVYERRRISTAEFETAEAASRTSQAAAQEQLKAKLAREVSIWGAFAEDMGGIRNGQAGMTNAEYTVQYGGEGKKKTEAAARFWWQWDAATKSYRMLELHVQMQPYVYAYYYEWDVQNGVAQRTSPTYGITNKKTWPYIQQDGALYGFSNNHPDNGEYNYVVKTPTGFDYVRKTKAGEVKWRASFVRSPGAYVRMRGQYDSVQQAKAEQKANGGGGIGGMLMGAVVGGALGRGSPDAIIAGARVFAPNEELRAGFDQQAADLAAQRDQQARDDARFRAQTAATIRQAEASRATGQPRVNPAAGGPAPASPAPQAPVAPTPVTRPAANPVAPAAAQVRYFDCFARDVYGNTYYGITTSGKDTNSVRQNWWRHLSRQFNAAFRNSGEGDGLRCSGYETLADAQEKTELVINRDRGTKFKQTTGIDLSY